MGCENHSADIVVMVSVCGFISVEKFTVFIGSVFCVSVDSWGTYSFL
jgi:hypothetical protein